MIEKDHLGDWSPERDCFFATDVSTTCACKPSPESSDSLSQLKIQKPW